MADVLDAIKQLVKGDTVRVGRITCYEVKNVGQRRVQLHEPFAGKVLVTHAKLPMVATQVRHDGEVVWEKEGN